MKQETKENQVVKIILEQKDPFIKVQLEGTLKQLVMLITDVAENSPLFKNAIIVSAEYFKSINN